LNVGRTNEQDENTEKKEHRDKYDDFTKMKIKKKNYMNLGFSTKSTMKALSLYKETLNVTHKKGWDSI